MDAKEYRSAMRICVLGIINQAIIINVTALLFVPFMRLYGFTYVQLGLITSIGFGAQMCADVTLLFLIDRVSRKKLAAFACLLSAAGLLFYGSVPFVFQNHEIYIGILLATAVFSFAGGMLEVVLSNLADSLPQNMGKMSLCFLHSLYAWAQAIVAALLFVGFLLFSTAVWNYAMFVFALIPLSVLFFLPRVKMPQREKEKKIHESFRPLYLFAVIAVFFGYGGEVVMNQWVSSFVSELYGGELSGLIGCALFAVFLGSGGAVYVSLQKRCSRTPLKILIGSALFACAGCVCAAVVPNSFAAVAAVVLGGFFVGVLSPGAMSAASGFLPYSGGWMLASLAVAQDIGASFLPSAIGYAADASSVRLSFLCMAAAPLIAAGAMCLMALSRQKNGKCALTQKQHLLSESLPPQKEIDGQERFCKQKKDRKS